MSANVVDITTTEGSDPDGLSRAIISTIGQDRPGLVSGITTLITDLQLSIDDSRMSILGGDFAVLMSVTGSTAALANLEGRLRDYCDSQGMAFLFRHSSERQAVDATPYVVTVTAMDHPGIVRSVASFFSQRSINILELSTETQPAAHTGTPIFSLHMTVELPSASNAAELTSAFEEFCLEQDLDGEFQSQAK
ncbi:MAG: glycine cleavage system protein R [Pseudomonadales bacterium]